MQCNCIIKVTKFVIEDICRRNYLLGTKNLTSLHYGCYLVSLVDRTEINTMLIMLISIVTYVSVVAMRLFHIDFRFIHLVTRDVVVPIRSHTPYGLEENRLF